MESILVVDDEEFLRNELTRILGEDYAVRAVGNGSEALGALSDEGADLVLLDLNLPDVHGIQVLREVKTRAPETLVIVITGYGSVESAVESLKLGAYDYIKKPFKADAIKLVVRLALETQRLRRQVRVLREREIGPEQEVVAESTRDLDAKASQALEVQAIDLAAAVSRLLENRVQDLPLLAHLPGEAAVLREFSRARRGEVWERRRGAGGRGGGVPDPRAALLRGCLVGGARVIHRCRRVTAACPAVARSRS